MRIAIVGTQNSGKTTLINTFKQYWPMYESPEKTYRDLIKEKNLTVNEQGSVESQEIIRDALIDLAISNSGKTKTIHDRCVIDNLVYTLWLAEKDETQSYNDLISSTFILTRESLKFYDIIFWLPLNPNIPLVESENRSVDESYRLEIDEIFHGIYENYKKNTGLIFDKEDQPVMIPLEGDIDDKISTIRQYLDAQGNLIETTESVLTDLETAYDEMSLRQQIRG